MAKRKRGHARSVIRPRLAWARQTSRSDTWFKAAHARPPARITPARGVGRTAVSMSNATTDARTAARTSPHGQELRAELLRFCRRYVPPQDAEDVVQEVFCKTLQSAEPPRNLRAWLFKLARNQCLNLLRARARHGDEPLGAPDLLLDPALTGNLTRMVQRERRSRLMHLVNGLSPIQREVLLLRYADGLTREEIADVLGISEALVKSRLFDGIEKLRQHRSLA